QRVEEEHDDAALLAESACGVGGADVAAAHLLEIDAARTRQEHAEGYRAEEEADRDGDGADEREWIAREHHPPPAACAAAGTPKRARTSASARVRGHAAGRPASTRRP